MSRAVLAGILAPCLVACATTPAAPPSLDQLARDYLAVQLAIGEKDPGYVDAYYGPAELAEAARAEAQRQSLPQLQARVIALDASLAALPVQPGTLDAARVRYLRAMLHSARLRLRILRGEVIPFADEAEGLFGVRPDLIDLASLEPVLAQIEALVPGEGPLWQRVNALQDRFIIPADRLPAVMDAALAECRARTLPHIALPESERFDLELVSDRPWGGFNYYQGGFHSKIEINTDLPIRLDRALDVGCHEAYPGHHVYGVLVERERVLAQGQIEHTLMPLYSPQALIAEGSAEYGLALAFPGTAQLEFERAVLAPLAGLDTTGLEDYHALREAVSALSPAYYTIAAGYLDGSLSREAAIEASMRYRLMSRERAEQSLRFINSYRSYVINYGLGEELVRDFVERGGADEALRWQRFITLLAEPMLPEDLR